MPTASALPWANSTCLGAATLESITRLKAQPGPTLRCFGSISLVRSLLAERLVDRPRLVVFPLLLGAAIEPLFEGLPDLDLELIEARTLDSRLIVTDYRAPAGAQAADSASLTEWRSTFASRVPGQ